jgi:phosphoribosylaminoimidazolecarboxamide formyltransferase / IMP cyclohydrolase
MNKYALLSVSDKTGILEFAQNLIKLGYTILSTGGTAKLLGQNNINVTEVADYTGFPEMLDGRVKTLNPKIHAGILAIRDNQQHQASLAEYNIPAIDIVAVNLYPFSQSIADINCTLQNAIENIDIGGPTMLRAAAKNYNDVTVVVDSNDYALVIKELNSSLDFNFGTNLNTRFQLAKKVFNHTAQYDGAIINYLSSININDNDNDIRNTNIVPSLDIYPQEFNLHFSKIQDLRYGENPHQSAALYTDISTSSCPTGVASSFQIQGKELSYNNIADADTAWECVKTFDSATPACVIVKHANPCGVGIGTNALNAYNKALQTDSTSAFGGIIALNVQVDIEVATAILQQFVEVIIAPSYTDEALKLFSAKANIRVLQQNINISNNLIDIKRIGGGILVQSMDTAIVAQQDIKIVTKLQPTTEQIYDMMFAWKVARFVKSNAIIFCKNGQTLGVGAGQMSRVDSAKIASIKAQHANLSLEHSAVASDAFFPFADGLDVVAEAGATCIIQPGGSIRDAEIIARADERGLVMAFTGMRHFKH